MSGIKKKLRWFWRYHWDFKDLICKPGVYFNHWLGEVEVSRSYWERIGGRQNETLDDRYLRRHRNEFYDELEQIFEVNGCGVLPEDLVGSPQFPIDIRSAEEDALAVVQVKDRDIVPVTLEFDDAAEGTEIAAATVTVGVASSVEDNYVEETDEDEMFDDATSEMTVASPFVKNDGSGN